MGEAMQVAPEIWRRMNLVWVAFFVVLGALNLYVVANFSMETWVNFKVFGIMGLTLVFALAQGVYLMRFDQSADPAANDD
jgi:intracellular septation protein